MAYLVGRGNAVTLTHPVRTVGGVLKTGEAANITTSLLDEAGAADGRAVTITEVGTTGWYNIAFTPDATGNWVLTATNPAGTDEAVVPYVIQVTSGAPIDATAGSNLTTLARVKEHLWSGVTTPGTAHDDEISNMIAEVSGHITAYLGRTIAETAYTEYYDGTGHSMLLLRQGPLVSVTSVSEVEYTGTTSRSESLTTVQEVNRLEGGLRSQGHLGLGWIEMNGSTFNRGQRNYKVVYTAGFANVPEAIVQAATKATVAEFLHRESVGAQNRNVGDGNVTLQSPKQVLDALYRTLAPYKTWAVA